MNLVCDEGVEREIVDRLRAEGHDVVYIAELNPGIADDEVLDHANASAAVLVTTDKDFGELLYRLGRIHGGVVLTRLAGLSPEAKAATVARVFRDHAHELAAAFCVIAPGAVRIRRRATPDQSA
jgi:predicted nuclease of predicted toxin-antitoxin system